MYRVRLERRAEKELKGLHPVDRRRVLVAIRVLRDDPRPPKCKKLQRVGAWRIRVGDYRVVYDIDDEEKTVTVLRIGHRKDVYVGLV